MGIGRELVLALVFAATTVATVVLAVAGLLAGVSFQAITPEARAERSAFLTAAFVVGTVVPLVCAIIAGRLELRLLRTLNLVLLAITLLAGLVSAVEATTSGPPRDTSPRLCQEHSGGDTTCPGG